MQLDLSLTASELKDFLLHVAPVRPVMVWGQPGIGKSAIIEEFMHEVGLECVSLLGSQIAPEDVLGVPLIVGGEKSRFCPPESIARDEPYGLFLDEINKCKDDVQAAFYSLIHEQRVGGYRMPAGSVVVAAGNRAQDAAAIKPMSSALVNRMVHVELRVDHRDWLAWAYAAGIHPLVTEYIGLRPDHLVSAPPKVERPFSTPRSWHALSEALQSYGDEVPDAIIKVLAAGTLSPEHARTFGSFVKVIQRKYALGKILDGESTWPHDPADRDALYFLARSLRARLVKELPPEKAGITASAQDLSYRAKAQIRKLASISLEAAQLVMGDADGDEQLPGWFFVEVARDVPRLAARDDSQVS